MFSVSSQNNNSVLIRAQNVSVASKTRTESIIMRDLKFCANLSFLFQEEENLLRRYYLAKDAGFKGVETGYSIYDVPVDDVRKTIEDTGLQQVLINLFPGEAGEMGLSALPGREEDFRKAVELTIKYADALNCKRIHLMAGLLPGGENSPTALLTLERNLRQILPELERRQIVGLLEPINRNTVPGYALSDFDEALSVVKAIGSPYIKLQLDFFHLQQIHGNITQRVKQLLPHTGHIQIAQVPTRNEPHLPGELNYDYVFTLLEQESYKEWIGLEYHSDPAFNSTVAGLTEWMNEFECSL